MCLWCVTAPSQGPRTAEEGVGAAVGRLAEADSRITGRGTDLHLIQSDVHYSPYTDEVAYVLPTVKICTRSIYGNMAVVQS